MREERVHMSKGVHVCQNSGGGNVRRREKVMFRGHICIKGLRLYVGTGVRGRLSASLLKHCSFFQ